MAPPTSRWVIDVAEAAALESPREVGALPGVGPPRELARLECHVVPKPHAVAAEERQREPGRDRPVGPERQVFLSKPGPEPLHELPAEGPVVPAHLGAHQVAILRLRVGRTDEAVPVAEKGLLAERSHDEAVGADAAAGQPKPAPDLPGSHRRVARDTPLPVRPEVHRDCRCGSSRRPRPAASSGRRTGTRPAGDPSTRRRTTGAPARAASGCRRT